MPTHSRQHFLQFKVFFKQMKQPRLGISQEGKKTRSQMDSCVIAEKEFFYKTITLHTVYSYSCIAFKLLKLFSLLTLLDD